MTTTKQHNVDTKTKVEPDYKLIRIPTCCGNPPNELEKQITDHMKKGYVPVGEPRIMHMSKLVAKDHSHIRPVPDFIDFLVQAVTRS